MHTIKINGRVIVEGKCTGKALVSKLPLSFLGGVDPADGKIIEKNHDLCGKCVKDKILVFPHGHGSTVGSYVLYSLKQGKMAPKAIINKTADPVIVVGAIISDIPMLDTVNIQQFNTGDNLEVDAYKGIITIRRQKKS
jgi:predicted aconitase with swiveling domain